MVSTLPELKYNDFKLCTYCNKMFYGNVIKF